MDGRRVFLLEVEAERRLAVCLLGFACETYPKPYPCTQALSMLVPESNVLACVRHTCAFLSVVCADFRAVLTYSSFTPPPPLYVTCLLAFVLPPVVGVVYLPVSLWVLFFFHFCVNHSPRKHRACLRRSPPSCACTTCRRPGCAVYLSTGLAVAISYAGSQVRQPIPRRGKHLPL